MAYKRKSWREKLEHPPAGLPKVVEVHTAPRGAEGHSINPGKSKIPSRVADLEKVLVLASAVTGIP